LVKEMDAHKSASVSTVYVPNDYTVWLGSEDFERLSGFEDKLTQDLSSHLLDHARRNDYELPSRPTVALDLDERLRLGEFGIQTRLVKAPRSKGAEPLQGERGHTMVYSASQVEKAKKKTRERLVETRAIVTFGDRRFVLEGPHVVMGRSRECECVIDDPNVSRRHAELRRSASGDWELIDLGSTNGIKVNGRRVSSARLKPGDELTLGTVEVYFDIEQ